MWRKFQYDIKNIEIRYSTFLNSTYRCSTNFCFSKDNLSRRTIFQWFFIEECTLHCYECRWSYWFCWVDIVIQEWIHRIRETSEFIWNSFTIESILCISSRDNLKWNESEYVITYIYWVVIRNKYHFIISRIVLILDHILCNICIVSCLVCFIDILSIRIVILYISTTKLDIVITMYLFSCRVIVIFISTIIIYWKYWCNILREWRLIHIWLNKSSECLHKLLMRYDRSSRYIPWSWVCWIWVEIKHWYILRECKSTNFILIFYLYRDIFSIDSLHYCILSLLGFRKYTNFEWEYTYFQCFVHSNTCFWLKFCYICWSGKCMKDIFSVPLTLLSQSFDCESNWLLSKCWNEYINKWSNKTKGYIGLPSL